MIKTILFDFDGTVADTLPIIFHAFRSTFRMFLQQDYSDEQIVRLFGPTETVILEQMIPPEKQEEALRHFFQLYEQEHRLTAETELVRQMLASVQQAGIRMGVVTGKGRRSAEISLRALDLTHFFDVMITGDEVVLPKPHPEGICMAMKQLGAEKETTCFVGDSDADIKAARAACITAVGVNWLSVSQKTGGFTPEPDLVFTDPIAFVDWVQKNNRRNR
ncbi:HAD family hydrolase [Brevibacillus sp. H7]|uniref:HAD family hydrolase n=1 Tax=Brevibacillus sp. H7 TaxID=3349138 RepID=UPI0037FA2940